MKQKISRGDFVIATNTINNIAEKSIGLVKNITENE